MTTWQEQRAWLEECANEGRPSVTGNAIRACLARLDAAERVREAAYEAVESWMRAWGNKVDDVIVERRICDLEEVVGAYDALVREQDGGR